jgi:surface polysaccharide O-acyltransferase-like enzyme
MQGAPISHRGLKSFGAVFAGLLFIVILSLATDILCHATGIYPPWFQPMSTGLWVVATAYRIIYGIVGSYITARLAPDRPMGHALVLGVIGLVLSIAGTVSTWNRGAEFGPKWYPIGLVLTALPCAWLGGKLFLMQVRPRA